MRMWLTLPNPEENPETSTISVSVMDTESTPAAVAGAKVTLTDKTDSTITSTCTSGTNSSEAYGTTVANRTTMTLVNSRISFDATTNGGTLTGTNPLYVSYQGTAYYTGSG